MRIKQVLNNNVVSAVDASGVELILTGRGLGFNTTAGDDVPENNIEKIFRLDDDKIYSRFKVLLNEIPVEIVQLTDDIVKLAQTSLNYQLSEGLYVSLADHLNFALERIRAGMEIHNPLQWEVRNFYQKEYLVGHQALALIASRTGVLLPDAEACSIALHIVNAGMNNQDNQVMEITRLIYQIQNIVKYWFGMAIYEQSINYHRFITHVKFFAQRVINGVVLDNDDEILFTEINQRHEKTLGCVNAISEFIRKNYNHQMTKSEKLYLTVHIYNVMHRNQNSI